jgi:hypothetical protein
MRKIFTLLFLVIASLQVKSQVIFSEDFDGIPGSTAGGAGTYAFPAGWLLANVDNRTPAAGVSYVNQAWVRREDFANSMADSCAFSTSWTNPEGVADDWMWTPAINLPAFGSLRLSWNAIAYDPLFKDGYEVRIMTVAPTGAAGVLGNMVTSSTLLFSNIASGENSTWTSREAGLNAYAGQTVYIGFRNNSNNKYLLLIDDIKVESIVTYDAELISIGSHEFSMVPLSQSANQALGGRIRNSGSQPITNVRLRADIFRNNVFVTTLTSPPTASLSAGASGDFTISPWSPTDTGTYTIKYFPAITEADQKPTNDTLSQSRLISDSVYARDKGVVTGALGIGAGNGGFLGQQYEIKMATKVKSVTAFFNQGYTGKKFAALIWNTDAGTGRPTTIFAATDTLLYPNNDPLLVSIPIFGGQKNLPVGKYVVTVIEFDSTVQLAVTAEIFTENRVFVNWPTIPGGGWQPIEVFGAGFRRTFILRMNLNDNPPLPVKIISFTGAKKQGGNQLNWFVAEQTNILHYEIERSTDGRNFAKVGTVKATSLLTDNYSFFDPMSISGTVFYRLRIEEKGQIGFSQVVRLQGESGSMLLTVWPNPVHSTLTLQSESNELLNSEVRITDIQGKVHKNFVIPFLPYRLDVSDLQDGIYLIQPLGKPAIKFIKQ